MIYIHNWILKKNLKITISDSKTLYSFQDFKKNFNYIVKLLLKKKFKKNKKILILSNNNCNIFSLQMATSYLGGISTIIDPEIKKNSLKYILDDFKPDHIFTDKPKNFENLFFKNLIFDMQKLINKKDNKLIKVNINRTPDDTVILIYTSGTTGRAKGIMCSHKNIVFVTKSIMASLNFKKEKIGLFLPLSFDYGLYQFYLSLVSNSNIYIGKPSDVGPRFLNIIQKKNITVLPLVTNHLKVLLILLKKKIKCKIKIVTNTGSEIPISLIKKFLKIQKKCKVFLMYGLSECKRVSILNHAKFFEKNKTVGKAIKGTKCWIVDKKGKKLGNDKFGQLVVQGKHVMQGYYNDKILSNKTFKKDKNNNSILYTGDFCSIDKHGYITFKGRKDDIFKYKNYRLSKKEIQDDLLKIKGIDDSFVYIKKKPFDYKMYVVSKLKYINLINKIKSSLDSYKFSGNIVKLKKIERNSRGKIILKN